MWWQVLWWKLIVSKISSNQQKNQDIHFRSWKVVIQKFNWNLFDSYSMDNMIPIENDFLMPTNRHQRKGNSDKILIFFSIWTNSETAEESFLSIGNWNWKQIIGEYYQTLKIFHFYRFPSLLNKYLGPIFLKIAFFSIPQMIFHQSFFQR